MRSDRRAGRAGGGSGTRTRESGAARARVALGLAWSLAGLLAGPLALGGCASKRVDDPSGSAERVDLAAFRADDDAPRARPAPTPSDGPFLSADANEATVPEAPGDRGGFVVVQGEPGTSPPGGLPAGAGGEAVLLDAKVGDLNGRPIFANTFFEPIAARLQAEAQRLPPQQWRTLAAQTIDRRLRGELTDELLRAEALSALSPAQRQGLRAFLDNIRENVVSENLGSAQLAERRLREQTGGSLEDFLREREEIELVRLSLLTDVYRRINVSWRDIRQRYERDADRFNPPPTAVFRLIRVPTARGEAVETINTQLAEGAAFETIAEGELNTFNPDGGGAQAATFDEGTYGETAFFGPEVLNEAAWSLGEGEWAGPIEFGSQTAWLLLEKIERVSIALYDAQLAIQEELTTERREEELQRYIERLIERSRVDNVEELRDSLLVIATRRYGPGS
ncbi:MAG: peptidylprolyl isomerase [Planctomycetota bacterium]